MTSPYSFHTHPVVVAKHRAQVKQCQELLAKFSAAELRYTTLIFCCRNHVSAKTNVSQLGESQQLEKEIH